MRKRTKDFEGCFECRTRKVKCDKSKPECKRCLRIGKTCPGYSFALVWVPPNHEFSKAQGRGGPCAYATWRGWPTLRIGEIDRLLTELDETPHRSSVVVNPVTDFFSVFNVKSLLEKSMAITLKHTPPPLGTTWDRTTRSLFHHYVNAVSPLMMPFHNSYNPWTTNYPRLALENETIRHALLGQAAAHLYHSGSDAAHMKILSLAHRGTALKHLQSLLHSRQPAVFEIKIAAILSLIMADIYFGLSDGWTSHIFGAIEVAMNSAPESPWLVSEMAWLTAQSVSLLYLRAKIDGSLRSARHARVLQASELSRCFLVPVSCHPDYGFTMGASQELAASLADCADIVEEVKSKGLTDNIRSEAARITERLLSMALSNSELESIATTTSAASRLHILHIHIFALGVVIRLQRSTLNPNPSELQIYTNSLFQGVEAFRKLASAVSSKQQQLVTPTIWPVFHAAVELYRPEDQQHARQIWLNELDQTAIGNRKHVQAVVERIWLTRKEQARLACASPSSQLVTRVAEEMSAGAITVDWLEIARSMELDLLLV